MQKRKTDGEGNGNPLQYSCLGNLMDRGAWQAIVHGCAESRTRLSDQTHARTTAVEKAREKAIPANLMHDNRVL